MTVVQSRTQAERSVEGRKLGPFRYEGSRDMREEAQIAECLIPRVSATCPEHFVEQEG